MLPAVSSHERSAEGSWELGLSEKTLCEFQNACVKNETSFDSIFRELFGVLLEESLKVPVSEVVLVPFYG